MLFYQVYFWFFDEVLFICIWFLSSFDLPKKYMYIYFFGCGKTLGKVSWVFQLNIQQYGCINEWNTWFALIVLRKRQHCLVIVIACLNLIEKPTVQHLTVPKFYLFCLSTLDPRHCSTKKMLRANTKEENFSHSMYRINLGNASVVLRSQTTLFASAFNALMPPSAVPMRSFFEKEPQNLKVGISISNNQHHSILNHICNHS